MNYSDYKGLPWPLANGGLNEYGVAIRDVWSPSRAELLQMTPADLQIDPRTLVFLTVRTLHDGKKSTTGMERQVGLNDFPRGRTKPPLEQFSVQPRKRWWAGTSTRRLMTRPLFAGLFGNSSSGRISTVPLAAGGSLAAKSKASSRCSIAAPLQWDWSERHERPPECSAHRPHAALGGVESWGRWPDGNK